MRKEVQRDIQVTRKEGVRGGGGLCDGVYEDKIEENKCRSAKKRMCISVCGKRDSGGEGERFHL
jgi:hypothetical protein